MLDSLPPLPWCRLNFGVCSQGSFCRCGVIHIGLSQEWVGWRQQRRAGAGPGWEASFISSLWATCKVLCSVWISDEDQYLRARCPPHCYCYCWMTKAIQTSVHRLWIPVFNRCSALPSHGWKQKGKQIKLTLISKDCHLYNSEHFSPCPSPSSNAKQD